MITRIELREVEKPEMCEKINTNGLVECGEDNLYPQFLVRLRDENPIHGGIINQKITFISAGGITIEGDDGTTLKNGNSTYTLEELITDNITTDSEIFNGYAVLFKRNGLGKWVAHPVDFELVRATEDGIWYEISDDWSTKTQSVEKTNWRKIKSIHSREDTDTEVILYNIFKPKQKTYGDDKKKKVTLSYYPVPTYSGGITSIMAGCEFDWFTLSEIVNGYQGGTGINLANGIPESTEKENEIIKRIKDDATDKKKKGGLVITFSDGQDRAPSILNLNGNNLNGRYIESAKQVARQIMVAHQVISPALFSIMNETLFGSKEELEIAYTLFKETYVKKRQKFISEPIQWALNMLNGTNIKISFNDYSISFEKQIESESRISDSLNKMSPLVATKILNTLTINEVRALATLPPLPEGDIIQPSTADTSTFMTEKDPVLEAFSKVGIKRTGVPFRKDIEVVKSETFDYKRTDEEFIAMHSSYAVDLNKDQETIIQMIKDGKSYNDIQKAFGKGGIWLSNQLVELGNMGVIDGWEVNEEAIQKPEFKVLYSYEVKAGLGSALIPTSREFCQEMIKLDRLYTRQEIDQISAAVDRNVWLYRGGWYHNPETDVTTPSCRHEWKQNIVRA